MNSTTAFACSYVEDVPWEEHPAVLAAGEDAAAYLGFFNPVLSSTPVKGTGIPFGDDVWDFRSYFNTGEHTYRCVFTGLPDEVKTRCKFFLLRSLEDKGAPSTSIMHVNNFKSIVSSVLRKKKLPSFLFISTDELIGEVESRKAAPRGRSSLYNALAMVYRFLIRDCGMTLPIDTERLRALSNWYAARSRELIELKKTPDIPREYLNAIISAAMRVMRNEQAGHNRRATACLILIETQLALRPCDLVKLRTEQLFTLDREVGGRRCRYIRYTSQKLSKPGQPPVTFRIRSNLLSTEAFETLLEIRESCPLSQGSDVLYVLDPEPSSRSTLPHSTNRYRKEFRRFLAEELPEMSSRDWVGARWSNISITDPQTGRLDKTVRVCAPVSAQFRVRLCTKLYELGYPQDWIDENMGHLSYAMQGYYARPKDTFQENVKYTERFIEDVAGNGTRLLGGMFGDEVVAYIDKFIEEGGFNVEEDISAIVKALGDKVVVRAKAGGACVKTSVVSCSKDTRTNELLCAYGLCPNLFHFYHSIDVTYASFTASQDTYFAALEAGHVREADKELNKLKDLCQRRLIPELDELEREVGRCGEDAIIERHTELYDIIAGRAAIRREAQEWMQR
ncbi:MAG: hypothetical protein ACI36V_06355 [Coriobacteriales bacterium]